MKNLYFSATNGCLTNVMTGRSTQGDFIPVTIPPTNKKVAIINIADATVDIKCKEVTYSHSLEINGQLIINDHKPRLVKFILVRVDEYEYVLDKVI